MSVHSVFRHQSVLSVIAIAILLALQACSDATYSGAALTNASITRANLNTYKVGIGDKLRLEVYGEKDLSGTFDVNTNGTISLPLIGEMPVAGQDTLAIRQDITSRLANGYLKSPKVTVEVDTYRQIYVHGEVRTGGAFPFKAGTRLRDAIAIAGGYTYRANTSYVVLSREGLKHDARVDMPSDILVMPGDNIRIPERFF
ncbi:MAG: polysaccharide biosynthesis/export family protein [Hyphomicrobiaceae bacterium]